MGFFPKIRKELIMATIFDPITICKLAVSNRLVMPPMATAKSDENDMVTDATLEYYQQRAKYGKVGLIITEHSYIDLQGKASPNQLSVATDDVIPALQRLTDTVHQEGVKVFAQINHAGAAAKSAVTGQSPVAPSAISHPRHQGELPTEMTIEQIHTVTERFAEAALRVKKAGFDGVEIHSAHGYLLNQFYSPLTNHRTDEYGAQSLDNRIRFHCQVIKAVREAVGEDYPISVRLGGCDFADGGSTIDDCVETCKRFEQLGVDLIDLSGGIFGYIRPGHSEPGYFKDMSTAVKEAVSIPVLLTGGVTALKEADELLAENCADLIGIGRALFKSPHWAD
jgi:2,4-dienoyl-CoA reductase-like NADH-dependent reductase (Old Yellow Enzyme family)